MIQQKKITFNKTLAALHQAILTENCNHRRYSLIIGDLNVNFDKTSVNLLSIDDIEKYISNNNLQLWMFFNIIKSYHFINAATLLDQMKTPTFHPGDLDKSSFTIDYIYSSDNFTSSLTSSLSLDLNITLITKVFK
ncbi:unnamed protein product [Rhizophagus irregularis]|uniref:Uncharacterized protein n=1 Tax=Rhizophagus irregularis TaxID=588596 RepID=A0A915ZSI4_9GLOM|nr:unnamed protein product [Rhizophagus irregularis]